MCYFPENIWNKKKTQIGHWTETSDYTFWSKVYWDLFIIFPINWQNRFVFVCLFGAEVTHVMLGGFCGFSYHFVFVCSLSSYERSSTCYVGRLLWFLLPLHCDPLNCDDTNLCKSATFVQKSGRKMVLWKIEIIHGCFSTTLGVIFLERDMLNICYQLQDDFL